MIVRSIFLDGFRNYENFSVKFSPEMNVICGENAQGKTNLMEAIYYLSGAKSHRTRFDRDMISFEREEGIIRALVEGRGREFQIEIKLNRGLRRTITVNHVKLKKASDLSGHLQTVLFCPEDLSLVRGGAALRRQFMDESISQLRPKYGKALSRYQKLLEHKTRILRDQYEKPGLLDVLEDFNESLAKVGAVLIHYRSHFIRRLFSFAEEIQKDFSGNREHLSLSYQTVSTVENPFLSPAELYPFLRKHQDQHYRAEISSQSCLSGPHKDDMLAEISGRPARKFASQGQTRTVALSLKLAERELYREDTGQWPVLLLDDVLSELDARRQEFVLDRISGGQVFITGCEVPESKRAEYKMFQISSGKLNDLSTI